MTATCSAFAATCSPRPRTASTSSCFVYGDAPTSGQRTGQLTVRSMLTEVRTFAASSAHVPRGRVAPRLAPLPEWKLSADALFAQVSFSIDALAALA